MLDRRFAVTWIGLASLGDTSFGWVAERFGPLGTVKKARQKLSMILHG